MTAPIVREIYQRYAEGETVRSIITSLNERHILTQKQKPFRPNSLHSVLCNRKYIGEYRYKDIIIPDGVPSIIPKDLFERVQMRVEKNKRTPARAKAEEEYLLTTKLFCGHCGRMMIGESGKSHTGAIYRYYKCSGAKRKLGCRKKAVKKDWIECIAVQYTMQRVFQDELIAQIADKLVELQNTEDNTLPLLRKQLADTNRGIENMLNAIQQGILTNSTKERLEELEKLREDLKASILQAELERPKYSREDIIEWISRFKYGDPSNKEYQRQIIDIFLNSIYVFDDRLVFTYNCKNGTQAVTLADVSAAFGSDLKPRTPPLRRRGRHIVRGDFFCKSRLSLFLSRLLSASKPTVLKLIFAFWQASHRLPFLFKIAPASRASISVLFCLGYLLSQHLPRRLGQNIVRGGVFFL